VNISLIIPIYNCCERLKRHLKGVLTWIHLVEEVIVVDSGSTDGTFELAHKVLSPFGAKFIHNPPGLYQSWNAGIAAATKKWIYFSTVEDPITTDGLTHLHNVIDAYDADIIISPPDMRNHDGSETIDSLMPSNFLHKSYVQNGISHHLLSRIESILLMVGFPPSGLIGSSASNLYRTELLQKNPFPQEYGHCGDTAWAISIAPFAKVAFTTQKCAQFYVQTSHVRLDPLSQKNRFEALMQLASEALNRYSNQSIEISTVLGWINFYRYAGSAIWDWMVCIEGYNKELVIGIEEMGENVVNLKKAINTIGYLQDRISYLENENRKAEEENKRFRGLKGAIKSIGRSFIKNK
jgi:glycosyltransferase involved in cell wall biosynthesis